MQVWLAFRRGDLFFVKSGRLVPDQLLELIDSILVGENGGVNENGRDVGHGKGIGKLSCNPKAGVLC